MTDEDGNSVAFTNDIHGNVLSRSWTNVTGCPPTGTCTTYYSYYKDTANPLDPRNNQLTAVRDARSSSATDSTYLTSYAYNPAGQLTSVTTPATPDFPSGRTTAYAYSAGTEAGFSGGTIPAGLLLSQTTPGQAVTSYSYYSNGDLAQVTDPAGRRTVYAYDQIGRPSTGTEYTTSYPAGLATSYTYNAIGQPLTVTYPGVTGQISGTVHTLQDSYSYNDDGDLLALTQSDLTGNDPSRTTSYTYDSYGNVATVTDPAGGTTGYNYDGSGNLISKIDADNNEWDYSYNEYNEVTAITLHANSTDQANPSSFSDLTVESYTYDPAGLLSAKTDALNRITNYAYDPGENLIAVTQTDPTTSPTTGRQTAYSYDNAGNLTSTSANGLSGGLITSSTVTSYTVDAAGRVTSQILDPTPSGQSASGYLNRTTSYTYDADNHIKSVTVSDPNGSATTSYGYDNAGNLASQTVNDGGTSLVTTWTRDQRGQPLSMTDPRGNAAGANPADYTTSYTYDQAGQLATVTGPPVQTQSYNAQTPATTRPVTSYEYDTYGDQTQTLDPNQNLTTTGYDGDGRVASVTQPPYTPTGGSGPLPAVSSYKYDGLGQLASATDPAGTTTYGYDALGNRTTRTDPQLTGQPAPGVWHYGYDNAGELTSVQDPTGAQTGATYDYFGDRQTATQVIRDSSQPTGTTQYNYDYLGDVTKITTAAGVVTNNSYDHAGELAATTDAYSNTTSYAYDYAGRVTSVTNPDQSSTAYTYDQAGNLTGATDYGPGPSPAKLDSQSFGYDLAGNINAATDGRNNTTRFTYNAASQLTQEVQPVSASSSITANFGYDPAGNQTSYTDGRTNTTWTTYNPWNLPESVIEPATTATPAAADRTYTTSYNASSLPATITQPGGVSQSSQYDQLGDLTQITGSGAEAATPTQSYGYDLAGRLTSASAPGGTDTFAYNDAGLLEGTTGPSGTASFTYNGDGQLASRIDAAGTTSYTYDQAGRLGTVTDPASGATLTYAYTASSQPKTISYAVGGTAGPSQNLTYSPLHQLAGDTLTSASGTTIASAGYGYDANGNLDSQTTTGTAGAAATTYGYDFANRLTSATTGGTTTTYGYDNSGNLTQAGSTTYNYDARNQLTNSASASGSTGYAWSPRGTLDTITPPGGTAQNYSYNALGQLATAPGSISYAYDGLGRLTTRTTTSATTTFAYSGTGNTLASDGTQNYTYDPAGALIGLKPATASGLSVLTNLHTDVTGLFSPAAATTTLTGSAAYSPYGTVTAASGTSSDLGYQSEWTDPATGQANMAARWYNPATGTFTTRDTLTNSPVPAPGNANPYTYADSNPLTGTDPTGHWSCGTACANDDFALWEAELADVGAGAETGAATAGIAGLETGPWDLVIATVGAIVGGVSAWATSGSPSGAPNYDFQGILNSASNAWEWAQAEAAGWLYGPNVASIPSGHSGSAGNSGSGSCIFFCYPPLPPPPPQDIYAGPNGASALNRPRFRAYFRSWEGCRNDAGQVRPGDEGQGDPAGARARW